MSDRSPRPPGHPKPSKASTDSHPRRQSHAASKRTGTPSKTNEAPEQKGSVGEEDVFANTQRVRTGDKTLLLCMDIDESGARPPPKEKPIEISIPDVLLAAGGSFDVSSIVGMELSLGFLSQSEDSMDKAAVGVSPDAAAKSVVEVAANLAPIPSALPALPIKRRMSRAEQFSALEKTIPNVKLDRQMRKTVVHTMVEMNIWKEDDEDDDDISLTASSPPKGHKSTVPKLSKANESPRKKSTMISPATAAALSPNRKGSVKPVPPTKEMAVVTSTATTVDSSNHQSHATAINPTTLSTGTATNTTSTVTATSPSKQTPTSSTLTAPTATVAGSARGKVPMHRPSQIPVNEQAQKRDDRQRAERDTVREALVNRAVQFLVDLNRKQDQELQQQQQQQQQTVQQHSSPTAMGALANKSPKEIKMIAVKKLTASLVDRALKRGRNFFNKEYDCRAVFV